MRTAKERLAERLKEIRNDLSLTQQQMAEKLGVSRMAYRYYENAERTPDVEFLCTLNRETGYPMEYLVGFTNNSTYDTAHAEKTIGLSTEAIATLRNNPQTADAVRILLEDELGVRLLEKIMLQLYYLGGNETDGSRDVNFRNSIRNTMVGTTTRAIDELLKKLAEKITIPEKKLNDPMYGALMMLVSLHAKPISEYPFQGNENLLDILTIMTEEQKNAQQTSE